MIQAGSPRPITHNSSPQDLTDRIGLPAAPSHSRLISASGSLHLPLECSGHQQSYTSLPHLLQIFAPKSPFGEVTPYLKSQPSSSWHSICFSYLIFHYTCHDIIHYITYIFSCHLLFPIRIYVPLRQAFFFCFIHCCVPTRTVPSRQQRPGDYLSNARAGDTT